MPSHGYTDGDGDAMCRHANFDGHQYARDQRYASYHEHAHPHTEPNAVHGSVRDTHRDCIANSYRQPDGYWYSDAHRYSLSDGYAVRDTFIYAD